MVTIAKVVAGSILIIMAVTWAYISCRTLELAPVSSAFMSVAGMLFSAVTGEGAISFFTQKNRSGKE